MLSSLRWLILPALAAGLLGVVPAPAKASKDSRPAFRVEDGAKMFSKEALDKADKKIEDIKNNYDRDLLIETVPGIPDNLKKDYESDKEGFFRTWSRKRYDDKGIQGIYVLICANPTRLFVRAGKKTTQSAFTETNQKALSVLLLADLKAKKPDKALLDAIDYVDRTLDRNIGKVSRTTSSAAPRNPAGQRKESGMSGIWGYVCIGLVVILGIWLLFGLVRAFTGGGGGGGSGPGGGGGYGGGGGGGGGFFSSLMGGMFGAAAGMYLYDSFFRGGSSASSWGSSAHAGDPSSSGPDDRTTGDGGAGGDFGGGGNDDADGGAGGDWGGGGGDTGGGGDWGGGGGDAGGGGDWGGGGGGGDFGGGGGDFGGGGGGGDW